MSDDLPNPNCFLGVLFAMIVIAKNMFLPSIISWYDDDGPFEEVFFLPIRTHCCE